MPTRLQPPSPPRSSRKEAAALAAAAGGLRRSNRFSRHLFGAAAIVRALKWGDLGVVIFFFN